MSVEDQILSLRVLHVLLPMVEGNIRIAFYFHALFKAIIKRTCVPPAQARKVGRRFNAFLNLYSLCRLDKSVSESV